MMFLQKKAPDFSEASTMVDDENGLLAERDLNRAS